MKLTQHLLQNKKPILSLLLLGLLLAVVLLSGCTSQQENTIRISGAYALAPMMNKWVEEYNTTHPDIHIIVQPNGAGQGMSEAINKIVNIGMVSREINQSEMQQGAFWVSVAKDAVVATINTENPVVDYILAHGLTMQQFKDIFITRNTTTWGTLIGNESITDLIVVYSRSDSCGAAETWAKYLGNYKQNDLTNVADSAIYGDDGLAEQIKRDKNGIGFNNIGYVYTKTSGTTTVPADNIIPVPIDLNENGVLDDNENVYTNRSTIVQAINDYVYPSPPARALHLVTYHNFTGITKDFVYWILTEGQQYVLETGYIPLPQETISDQLTYLEQGTRPEIESLPPTK